MVVASADHDAPLLIHLLDDRPEAAAAERSAAVRGELRDRGAHVVSDHPVEAPPSLQTVRLAPGELEVLRLVALGRGTRQIADELGISPHTVRNHVRHFRGKLNAGTKLEAVLTAMRLGILREPQGWTVSGVRPRRVTAAHPGFHRRTQAASAASPDTGASCLPAPQQRLACTHCPPNGACTGQGQSRPRPARSALRASRQAVLRQLGAMPPRAPMPPHGKRQWESVRQHIIRTNAGIANIHTALVSCGIHSRRAVYCWRAAISFRIRETQGPRSQLLRSGSCGAPPKCGAQQQRGRMTGRPGCGSSGDQTSRNH